MVSNAQIMVDMEISFHTFLPPDARTITSHAILVLDQDNNFLYSNMVVILRSQSMRMELL